jgi:hypothetical protein
LVTTARSRSDFVHDIGDSCRDPRPAQFLASVVQGACRTGLVERQVSVAAAANSKFRSVSMFTKFLSVSAFIYFSKIGFDSI